MKSSDRNCRRHPIAVSRFGFCCAALVLAVLNATVQAADIAFVNVNVITMASDTVLTQQTLVVRNGRIESIGDVDDTLLPDSATVVDGTDRFLIPGLAEMHAHIPDTTSPDLQRVLGLYVANGITLVRGMLGQASHLALRAQLEAGNTLGPRLVTSGPSFNGNSVDSPQQAATMVRAQQAAGYDFLKIHPGLTRNEFVAIAKTANDVGIRFAGHVPADVGVPMALDLGISTIDHLDGYMRELLPAHEDPTGGYGGFFGVLLAGIADEKRIPSIAAATEAAGTWIVPTQSLFEHVIDSRDPAEMRNWLEMKYMPVSTVDEWAASKREVVNSPGFERKVADRAIELRRMLIRELHRQGVVFLLGSDSPQIFNVPGFSIHRELDYLVTSGLTPFQALRTGTVNAARWTGQQDDLGTIAIGKLADMVLLDDNPLTDIGNTRRIHGVMLRGRWFSRQYLDRLLRSYERDT